MKLIKKDYINLNFKNSFHVHQRKVSSRTGLLLTFNDQSASKMIELPFFEGLSGKDKDTFFSYSDHFIEAVKKNDLSLVPNHPSYFFAWSCLHHYDDIHKKTHSCNFHPMMHAKNLEFQDFQDFSIIKVKVSMTTQKKDLEIINSFSKSHPNLKLRIDANQSFTCPELLSFWNALQFKQNIDYFEEPCLDYDQTISHIPIALDEKAKDYLKSRLKLPFKPKCIVIKPSLWGNIEDVIKLKDTKNDVVISSCFEHPHTLKALVYLASFFPNQYHGLSTYQLYEDYLDSLEVYRDKIETKKSPL